MNWAIIGCTFFQKLHAGCFILKSTVSEAVEGCMPSVTFCFGCHDPRVCTALLRVMSSAENKMPDNMILAARTSALEKEGREVEKKLW